MSLAQIVANLPALVIAIPLLLSPVAAMVPVAGLAWLLAVIGSGGAFLCALLLQGAVTGGESFSYFLGNWPPPWGIEPRSMASENSPMPPEERIWPGPT